jgi:hypothetical protein
MGHLWALSTLKIIKRTNLKNLLRYKYQTGGSKLPMAYGLVFKVSLHLIMAQ